MKNISRKLARIPSLYYLISFFLLIPIFAGFYSLSSRAFKSSTTNFEPSLSNRMKELALTLTDEIQNPTVQQPASRVKIPDYSSIKLQMESFSIYFNKATPDSIIGRIILSVVDSLNIRYQWFGDISLHAYSSESNNKRREKSNSRPLYIDVSWSRNPEPNFTKIQQKELEDYIFRTPYGSDGFKILYVPVAIFKDFKNFFNTVDGLPSGFIDSYPRMLYFSVVTITTLGYGDIVPVNALARFLISLESLCGVLLIGLFLNSLAHESKS